MEKLKLEGGILTFERRLKKNETYKFSKNSKFISLNIFKKPQLLKGIASYCEDNSHTLFIDYDDVPRWLIEQDVALLQREYNLPAFYLVTTKEKMWEGQLVGNYHLINITKHTPAKVYEMLSKTHADVNYFSMPLRRVYRNWVLRISTKIKRERPKFLAIVGEQINLDKEVSKPHLEFLKKIYNVPEIKYTNVDKCEKIFLQEYYAS